MHQNSILLFKKYGIKYFSNNDRVLEVGARIPSSYLENLGNVDVNWNYIDIGGAGLGGDINSMERTESLNYKTIDNYNFDVGSGQFDVVISGQVLEHVPKAWVWMNELARIIKQG